MYSHPAFKCLGTATTLLLGAAIFNWAAIYNGFPLLYSDAVSYLFTAKFFQSGGERPVFYGLFLALTRFFLSSSWITVSVQGLLTALVIRWVLCVHDLKKINFTTLVICVALALLTGNSWQIGQLMADAFTPLVFLSFYLLVFRREELGLLRLVAVATIFFCSLLVHYSHWAISLLGIAGLCVFFRLLRDRTRFGGLVLVLNLIFATLPLTVAVNQSLGFSFLYAKNQYAFLVSRMLENGSLLEFLEENCDQKNFVFCDRRERLKDQRAVDFLWGQDNPYRGGADQTVRYRELVVAMLLDDPIGQVSSAFKAVGFQLLRFRSGDGLIMYKNDSQEMQGLRQASPTEVNSFVNSRQQSGELSAVFTWLNPVYISAFLLSVLFLAAFSLRAGPAWIRERELAAALILLCLSNAFVCGIFSGAYDRYQSRVAWLPVFAALVILLKKASFFQAGRDHLSLQEIE